MAAELARGSVKYREAAKGCSGFRELGQNRDQRDLPQCPLAAHRELPSAHGDHFGSANGSPKKDPPGRSSSKRSTRPTQSGLSGKARPVRPRRSKRRIRTMPSACGSSPRLSTKRPAKARPLWDALASPTRTALWHSDLLSLGVGACPDASVYRRKRGAVGHEETRAGSLAVRVSAFLTTLVVVGGTGSEPVTPRVWTAPNSSRLMTARPRLASLTPSLDTTSLLRTGRYRAGSRPGDPTNPQPGPQGLAGTC